MFEASLNPNPRDLKMKRGDSYSFRNRLMVSTMAIIGFIARLALLALSVYIAWDIRMYSIRIYGMLIHEFDPWFNFHATRYLFENGLEKFFKWFDHTVWYPLGRPVGTTIYPGMQLTSVGIWHFLDRIGKGMSLNDICVFVPTWFAGIASVFTGLLAAECSGMPWAAPAAALVMSVIPAHTMRSMGGGYDNESIAVAAMVSTFYLWTRALRDSKSWPIAFFSGLAYIYMVAAWGGYVFVLNVVGAHVALLILMGRYDSSLYKAYTLFFVVGTLGAIQVPCVAWVPLKSMEQIGPLGIFFFVQLLEVCEVLRKQKGMLKDSQDFFQLRRTVFMAAGGVAVLVLSILLQTGYLMGLSARVRGLFLHAVRTGNPLVDSVAEHQPTSPKAYYQHLHFTCSLAPIGWFMCFQKPTNNKIFLIMYSALGYFFSNKMSRLIILMGPIASALSGIALAAGISWAFAQIAMVLGLEEHFSGKSAGLAQDSEKTNTESSVKKEKDKLKKRVKTTQGLTEQVQSFIDVLRTQYLSSTGQKIRVVSALGLCLVLTFMGAFFFSYSHMFAYHISSPSIVYRAQLGDGRPIIVRDYLDTYEWIKANTPEGSRVLSWWDYGYQITGIANRTTLADGNTWNIHHIALIGRCLTSEEKRAHELVRHLADYVLVWSGGSGDDLGKSPHIARIGTSVYHDICPNDPMCYSFGFTDDKMTPTPTMAASLLYKLCENGKPGVKVDESLFKQVYVSKYAKVKVYKVMNISEKSRDWVADPANKLCDRPGSWYCPGQYPPDLPEKIGTSYKSLTYGKHDN